MTQEIRESSSTLVSIYNNAQGVLHAVSECDGVIFNYFINSLYLGCARLFQGMFESDVSLTRYEVDGPESLSV